MSEICINIAQIKKDPQGFRDCMECIKNQIGNLSSIKNNICLGASTGLMKKKLEDVAEALDEQYTGLNSLAKQLDLIIQEYQQTEKGLADAVLNAKKITDSSESTGDDKQADDDSYLENAIQQAIQGEFYEGETNMLGDILSLIISFIPGLNCAADIRDLAADIMNAAKDGKLSGKEIVLIALDVVTLVGDVISLGALVKGIKGATKTAKVAKTAQKSSAKQAKKMAKESAKKAKNAAKDAAEKGTRKTVRKATKTAQDAAKKAEASKAAKTAAKKASKEYNEKVAKEAVNHVKKEVTEKITEKNADEITQDIITEEYKKNTRDEMKNDK